MITTETQTYNNRKRKNEPQTISTLISLSTAPPQTTSQCPSDGTRRLLAKFPSARDFNATYNATNLCRWAQTKREHCLTTTLSPTLGALADAYGSETATGWLAAQIANINGVFNIHTDKELSPAQCALVASTWVANFPALKCSEVWVFLSDWICGAFGKKLYGVIDPTEMGADLAAFIKRRNDLVYAKMREQERVRRDMMLAECENQIREFRKLKESEAWNSLPPERQKVISDFLAKYFSPENKEKENN